MFFHRKLLDQIGGFPDQPLMEDIEVSKRLRLIGEFRAPQVTIAASGELVKKGFFGEQFFYVALAYSLLFRCLGGFTLPRILWPSRQRDRWRHPCSFLLRHLNRD